MNRLSLCRLLKGPRREFPGVLGCLVSWAEEADKSRAGCQFHLGLQAVLDLWLDWQFVWAVKSLADGPIWPSVGL